MNKVWYKWPEGYIGTLVPWYKLLYRAPLFVTAIVGMTLMYYSLVAAIGYQATEDLLGDSFG